MTTPHIDTGITGAKRQSWKRANPRDVLKRLIDKHPELSEEEIEAECWDILHRDIQQMRTVFEYWFANNYRSLINPRASSPTGKRAKTATARPATQPAAQPAVSVIAAAIEAKVEEHIEAEAKAKVMIILGDMLLPNGKTVRQSTREELLTVGPKFNGFTQRLAAQLEPGQTVDEAGISEDDLTALYVDP